MACINEENKKVAFATLGCKLNYSESSYISKKFAAAGYRIVEDTEFADVYVVNTCTVTEHADKKCRNIIRRLHKINKDAIIAVIGCYAQLKPEEIAAIEGVSIVLGAAEKGNVLDFVESRLASMQASSGSLSGQHAAHSDAGVPENGAFAAANPCSCGAAASSCQPDSVSGCIIRPCRIDEVDNVFPAYSSVERTRSFLKVQDGCDYKCSYCTIPLARGKSRNLPISTLVGQAAEIAASGIKEIVITGVNTGDFGKTTGEDFLDLLKGLDGVQGIERYRISSIEPNLLRQDIIEWIASGTKFMPHFHIPLQSGSDAVLKRMRRRYTTSIFADKIRMICSIMERPGSLRVFFGIDLIAGFPGESDAEFMETYDFLENVIRPSFIHVFPYSIRPNTPAASFKPQVKDSVKTVRVEMLSRLSDKLYADFCKLNEGLETDVLFEQKTDGGMMSGYSENYIRVERPYDAACIGKICKVVL